MKIFLHTFTKYKASLPHPMDNCMKMFTALLLASFIFLNIPSHAQDSTAAGKKKIYTFTLRQEIYPSAWRLVKKAVDEAEEQKADYLIMRLNTYGGMVDIADSIRTKLLKAKPITVVFIDNNAASAGALISIACDSIYMSKGASMGAATVVSGGSGEKMPDKYQSYMRSTMRSTAEAQGRDPKIAEAMVDDRSVIPGLIDSGYTLTFTTEEAIKHGYCEGEASSIEEVIGKLDVKDYQLIEYNESAIDNIIAFLMNPVVSGILMLVIIGGVYFEFQHPGIGFPIIAAIIAAILYFAPLYLEGLAENWEILIFIIGIILLAIEIFVIPGFGVTGVTGIMLIVSGLTLSLIRNVNFDFTFTSSNDIAIAIFRVVFTLLTAIVLFLFFGERIMFTGPFRRVALLDTQNKTQGYSSLSASIQSMIGKTGIATTDLRPAGAVEIDNDRFDAVSDGELIPKGAVIKVVKAQSNYLVVTKA